MATALLTSATSVSAAIRLAGWEEGAPFAAYQAVCAATGWRWGEDAAVVIWGRAAMQ